MTDIVMDNRAIDNVSSLPFLTADLPGAGGLIKRFNEDFQVEEVPQYEPSGEGTHVYFTIEKQGLTTLAAVRMIAHALGRKPHEIGYAGLKDAHAVTRQMLSLEHVDPAKIERLELARIRVLGVSRHRNKLKLGHLRGNRFAVKVRGDGELPKDRPVGHSKAKRDSSSADLQAHDSLMDAERIMTVLAARGAPNYFGPQRFGTRGDNAVIGRAVSVGDFDKAIALILGRPGPHDTGAVRRARELFDAGDLRGSANEWPRSSNEQRRLALALLKTDGDARKAWRACDHTLRKLYGSALQSELFNAVLATRIRKTLVSGTPFAIADPDQVEAGDLAWLHRNGACFSVDDAEREQTRCLALEISPTGPLYGRRMTEPTGRPALLEETVLAESGLARDQIRAESGNRLDGARRPLRVPLGDWSASGGRDERSDFLELRFMLPPGAYATAVLREVCKSAAME
jgi:tRNA pseudouridine13 synthase